MRGLVVIFASAVCIALIYLVNAAGHVDLKTAATATHADSSIASQIRSSAFRVNNWFDATWSAESVNSVSRADELTILRRLSLALHGTIPSLEEIREFEDDGAPDRIVRWTDKLLSDPRYSDYFSERLARSLVGVEDGPFILFRRDQMTAWLSQQLRADTPWTEMASQMIAAEGLWTDRPAANFITIARIEDEGLDVNKLAGRTVRTFLGQRIDCAQCHDHPFDERWKQGDFEGLAAWFAPARITIGGVTDTPPANEEPTVYRIAEPGQSEEDGRIVDASVPFHEEWLPGAGTARSRLAAWVTHPENRRFERAISNRIWGLMFGRSFHDPVDDLPHPADTTNLTDVDLDLLDILGEEFRSHGSTLKNLIRVIAQSKPFQLSSSSDAATDSEYRSQEHHWAVFPLVRLRPEQIIGSLFQASSVRTIDQNSHVFIRFQRFINENDFIKEYGDLGDDELLQQVGTIPQALLRMNGRFTQELSKADGFSAAAQMMRYSENETALIRNCFLTCLTRKPTDEELEFFIEQFPDIADAEHAAMEGPATQTEAYTDATDAGQAASNDNDSKPDQRNNERRQQHRRLRVEDLFWTLFNSPEFSWNH